MLTVLDVIKRTSDFFAGKEIESPRLNAELLIGHALGRGRMQLYLEFERPLTEAELEHIRPLVRRRAQREPLQYIVGETDFHGLKLQVDRRALIPRPETEYLVELVIAAQPRPPARILDLGTGSGAIALALAKAFPAATVVATDVSPAALELARANAAKTGLLERVEFLESNWFARVPQQSFNLIVSNPPYLSPAETAETAPEVRGFEPANALTGQGDGSGDIQAIIGGVSQYLAPAGLLALETGITQHGRILAWMEQAGFGQRQSRPDLTGRDRYVLASR